MLYDPREPSSKEDRNVSQTTTRVPKATIQMEKQILGYSMAMHARKYFLEYIHIFYFEIKGIHYVVGLSSYLLYFWGVIDYIVHNSIILSIL